MNTKNEYMLMFVGNNWYNDLSYPEIKKLADDAKAWLDGLIAQGKVNVHPSDTPDVLAARILEVEHQLYPAALRLLAEGKVKLEKGLAVFA